MKLWHIWLLIICGGFNNTILLSQPCMLEVQLVNISDDDIQFGSAGLLSGGDFTDIYEANFTISTPCEGIDTLAIVVLGFNVFKIPITFIKARQKIEATLTPIEDQRIDLVTVMASNQRSLGLTSLRNIQDFTVYEGKKNEVILLKDMTINTATSNPRQLFGKVTGINIWESDGAGLQLGIGGRGLSPDRTAHFNVRQNGYDITADALGYPEAYFQPMSDAIEKIEVIRGAAGLQYGPQFGGSVNFIYKKPSEKPINYIGEHTLGSWAFASTYNQLSGTVLNDKLSYFGAYNYKRGNGWRDNSEFKSHNSYIQVNWKINQKWSCSLEGSKMHYLTQQAGGLTDAMFATDPRQSVRSRNWFGVDWNLYALTVRGILSPKWSYRQTTFALNAQRASVGNLEKINVADIDQPRNLIDGRYKNIGQEHKLIHRYKILGKSTSALYGARLYYGTSRAFQGKSESPTGPDFSHSAGIGNIDSDYSFENVNTSLFSEHVITLSEHWTLTPGVRWEYINTTSDGQYNSSVYDFAGNIISSTQTSEYLNSPRQVVIAGVGGQYNAKGNWTAYANISTNYRPVNFTDLRINIPSLRIDSTLSDERGYTSDLGINYTKNGWKLNANIFTVYYANRIGQILKSGEAPLYIDYRLRTNIGQSTSYGIDCYFGKSYVKDIKSFPMSFNPFINVNFTKATYNSPDKSINGNNVEMVPMLILRSGIDIKHKKISASLLYNYTSQQYSDASNAVWTPSAVEGIIPRYHIIDLTVNYQISKSIALQGSINNLLNASYFTRRAASYPGPGILPGDGRSLFLSIAMDL